MIGVRNRRDLEQQVQAGKYFHYLLFDDAPMSVHNGKYNYLSQWYGAPFRTEGTLFKTVEHFVVAEKARLFKDLSRALQAIMAKTPERAAKTGQAIEGVSEDSWAECCLD